MKSMWITAPLAFYHCSCAAHKNDAVRLILCCITSDFHIQLIEEVWRWMAAKWKKKLCQMGKALVLMWAALSVIYYFNWTNFCFVLFAVEQLSRIKCIWISGSIQCLVWWCKTCSYIEHAVAYASVMMARLENLLQSQKAIPL